MSDCTGGSAGASTTLTPSCCWSILARWSEASRPWPTASSATASTGAPYEGSEGPEIALRELASGAIGLICAKVGRVEVMAAAGIRDVLLFGQVVGLVKVTRLVNLLPRRHDGRGRQRRDRCQAERDRRRLAGAARVAGRWRPTLACLQTPSRDSAGKVSRSSRATRSTPRTRWCQPRLPLVERRPTPARSKTASSD